MHKHQYAQTCYTTRNAPHNRRNKTNEPTNERTNQRTNQRTNERMRGRSDGRTDGQSNKQTNKERSKQASKQTNRKPKTRWTSRNDDAPVIWMLMNIKLKRSRTRTSHLAEACLRWRHKRRKHSVMPTSQRILSVFSTHLQLGCYTYVAPCLEGLVQVVALCT